MGRKKSSVERYCLNCLNAFEFKLSQLAKYKGGGKFCSRNCHYSYFRNNHEKHPLFSKDKIDPAGYRLVRIDGLSTMAREHRYLMEKTLGRKLRRNEHVHHINGMKADNRLENLVVLTASEHRKEHNRMREAILRANAPKKPNYVATELCPDLDQKRNQDDILGRKA